MRASWSGLEIDSQTLRELATYFNDKKTMQIRADGDGSMPTASTPHWNLNRLDEADL